MLSHQFGKNLLPEVVHLPSLFLPTSPWIGVTPRPPRVRICRGDAFSTVTGSTKHAVPFKRPPTHGFKYTMDLSRRPNQKYEGSSIGSTKAEAFQAGVAAEKFLGKNMFSMESSLGDVLGNFRDVINLFTLRNSHKDHPLFFLSLLLEAEANYKHRGGTNPFPLWRGMMVLLATKMFGYADHFKAAPPEVQSLTINRHVRMAKIAEIAYLTQQIHKRIVDSGDMSVPGKFASTVGEKWKYLAELNDANKTSTLVGDLLWAQTCAHMAALKCQTVSELICEFLMDYCESEFMLEKKCNPEQFRIDSWFRKSQLGIGSMLGRVMSSTLLFSGHTSQIRDIGYKLGVLLGLTYQAHRDIQFFNKVELDVQGWLDMGLLPVVLKIRTHPLILKELPSKIHEVVRKDEGVMEESVQILRFLQEDTLTFLNEISDYVDSERAGNILQNFVMSL